MAEKKLKKRLLYLIGPGFMVMGHSKNTLDYLVKGYNVIVASGKTSINCRGFEHQTLNAFSRNPNLLKDLFLFIEVFRVIKGTKPDIVIFSTPKIAFFSMLACVYLKVPCLYIHRGAVY
jgi:hypothetical protein